MNDYAETLGLARAACASLTPAERAEVPLLMIDKLVKAGLLTPAILRAFERTCTDMGVGLPALTPAILAAMLKSLGLLGGATPTAAKVRRAEAPRVTVSRPGPAQAIMVEPAISPPIVIHLHNNLTLPPRTVEFQRGQDGKILRATTQDAE